MAKKTKEKPDFLDVLKKSIQRAVDHKGHEGGEGWNGWNVYNSAYDLTPKNPVTGKEYNGVNALLLSLFKEIRMDEALKEAQTEYERSAVIEYYESIGNHPHNHLFMTFNQMKAVSEHIFDQAEKGFIATAKKEFQREPTAEELDALKEQCTIKLKPSADTHLLSKGILLTYFSTFEFWKNKKYKGDLFLYNSGARYELNDIKKTDANYVYLKNSIKMLKNDIDVISRNTHEKKTFFQAEKDLNQLFTKGFNVHSLAAMDIPDFVQQALNIKPETIIQEKQDKHDGESAVINDALQSVKALYNNHRDSFGLLSLNHPSKNACVMHPLDINDKVTQIPPESHYVSKQEFIRSIFHEMGHATGSFCGLGTVMSEKTMIGPVRPSLFHYHEDIQSRAEEELVAELCSILVCQKTGMSIAEQTSGDFYDNRVHYLGSWASMIQDDPVAFERAVKNAGIASSYIVKRLELGAKPEVTFAPPPLAIKRKPAGLSM